MLTLLLKALLRPSFHTVMKTRKHGYYHEENPSAIDGNGRRAEDVTEQEYKVKEDVFAKEPARRMIVATTINEAYLGTNRANFSLAEVWFE